MRGFTLVELMVTLAVMAILATAAVPSFVDFFERNRVRGAADGVISVVSNARAEAVKNALDVNVRMRGSGTAWCVGGNAAQPPSGGNPAIAAAACDCTDTDACLVSGQRLAVDVGQFPGIAVGALPTELTFDHTLGLVSPMGSRTVVLTSPSGKYDVAVQVNSLGQARMCTPAGSPMMSGVPAC
jgi:type IV fimbrial biogenesis protein FimT